MIFAPGVMMIESGRSTAYCEPVRSCSPNFGVAPFLKSLERNYRVFTPTEKNWLESGRILSKIQADKGFEPRKLRDLHFDVLIALTIRSHGACLITSNRDDFELIRTYRDFQLEVW